MVPCHIVQHESEKAKVWCVPDLERSSLQGGRLIRIYWHGPCIIISDLRLIRSPQGLHTKRWLLPRATRACKHRDDRMTGRAAITLGNGFIPAAALRMSRRRQGSVCESADATRFLCTRGTKRHFGAFASVVLQCGVRVCRAANYRASGPPKRPSVGAMNLHWGSES